MTNGQVVRFNEEINFYAFFTLDFKLNNFIYAKNTNMTVNVKSQLVH